MKHTPKKESPKYVRKGIMGLYDSTKQAIVDWIVDIIFKQKCKAAQEKANQFKCKVYLIQRGYFTWVMPRTAEIDWYKNNGHIARDVNFIELTKISARVFLPKKESDEK
jgi:hypothetical protein